MSRSKLLIFVDADVVARHFLDSGAFATVSESHDVTLIFPPLGWKRLVNSGDINQWSLRARRISIPERRRTLFKRMFFIDQARQRHDPEWRDIRNGWMAMVGWKAALLFSLLALPLFRQLAKAWIFCQLARTPSTELNALLEEEKPDIIVHPSTFEGYFINDIIDAARARGIPIMLLMNSWDNPCLKRSALGHPDAVVVWGKQTRRHTEKFMGVSPERIHAFGSAQFQVFRDPPIQTRDEICAANGIDASQRVLLYAGSSKGNREPMHLQWLNEAVEEGHLAEVTVLYRPHPYGIARKDAQEILARRFPHVFIEHSMRYFLENVAEGKNQGFHITPYQQTHALLSAVDAVISPLSTILIEAGLHGKPIMCFIPEEEDRDSMWRVLRKLVHFRELTHNSSVIVARTHAEFLPAVQKLLARSKEADIEQRMREAMRFFVEFPEQRYSDAIGDLADRLIAQRGTE